MKTTITTLFAICILCINGFAQNAHYLETSFESNDERSFWQLYKLGEEPSPFNLWNFENAVGHTGNYSMVHYYPVGATAETDDWFVSGEFNFAGGGNIDSIWTFYAGFGTPMGIDTVALYLIIGNQDPALASTQQLLHLFTDSAYQNDNTWRKISDINIPPTSGNSHLAFRYKTMNNWLDVKFDDLGFTINWPQAINEFSKNELGLKVFPNPSFGTVNLEWNNAEIATVTIVDLIGKTIVNTSAKEHFVINDLPKGMYFVNVRNQFGAATKKLILN